MVNGSGGTPSFFGSTKTELAMVFLTKDLGPRFFGTMHVHLLLSLVTTSKDPAVGGFAEPNSVSASASADHTSAPVIITRGIFTYVARRSFLIRGETLLWGET